MDEKFEKKLQVIVRIETTRASYQSHLEDLLLGLEWGSLTWKRSPYDWIGISAGRLEVRKCIELRRYKRGRLDVAPPTPRQNDADSLAPSGLKPDHTKAGSQERLMSMVYFKSLNSIRHFV